MTRMFKSLLGTKRNEPTIEEVEAMERATFLLRRRVERMMDNKLVA